MAQSIAGTGLAAGYAASVQAPYRKVEVQWGGANWTNETAYCLSAAIEHALFEGAHGLPALGRGRPSTATLVMDNATNRYSPDNAASPIHAHISGGIYRVPVRVTCGYGGEGLVQFVGEIEEPGEWETVGQRRVSLKCVDRAIGIQQKRHTTALHRDVRIDAFMQTLLYAGGVAPAALDKAMSEIPYAWTNDEQLLEELSKLAQADGGMVHFDKAGTFRFWRMSALLERADSRAAVATLVRGACYRLSDAISWRNVYDGVTVEATPRTRAPLDIIHEAQRPIAVPPGETVPYIAQYRHPAEAVIAPLSGVDYMAISSGGKDLRDSLMVTFTGYAQQADVSFQNTGDYHTIYVVDFSVRGYPLWGEEAEERREPGDKVYHLAGNPYIQTDAQTERLTAFLRDRLAEPRRLWGFQGPLCPWLELGDRVAVESAPQGLDGDAWVVGMAIEASRAALSMTLTLLPCAGLYPHDDYFVIGTSYYADANSDRVFY